MNEHSRLKRERFFVENDSPFEGFSPGVVTVGPRRACEALSKTGKAYFGGNVWHICNPEKLLLVCKGT